MEFKEMLFLALGGLGIFLFGIKYMSEGLQKTAGDRMRLFLEKGTKTPLRGVITGTLVTALIQSSSGTTVLTVGLVNAGLLTLRQAIGIIMGANIGTTMTAYLIGFKLEEYALPIIAVGVLMLFFFKNKKVTQVGQIFFGFGMLFYGMDLMGQGLKPLKNLDFFLNMMANVDNNPLLGVVIGTVFTVIVQSSSATIGILQQMAEQGVVTYHQAVPILFGDNIGTTITALLAAIGTTVAARRAALTHTIFNITGTLVFLPLFMLGVFPEFIRFATNNVFVLLPGFEGTWETLNIKMQIAQTHGMFNITNTLVQLPLVSLLAMIVTKLVPGKDALFNMEPEYLEPRLLTNPSVALGQASQELSRMGRYSSEFFSESVRFFFNPKDKEVNPMYLEQKEELINRLDATITDYLVKLSANKTMTEEQSKYASTLLQAVNDLERIGDHAENIVESTIYSMENKFVFSEEALASVRTMAELTEETLNLALKSFENNDRSLARLVIKNEVIIDNLEKEFRYGHIMRLNEGFCAGAEGSVFLDLLSNMERIGDHSVNLAEYVLGRMGTVERQEVKMKSAKIAMGED
ncbi:Na/Pi-cotransporter II-related protein [Desulforamulus reducens MI-1]|uniref:Na/Pi-cotransporter II-related protein n=1 Tax=Desulforamulus reducens (strain ATCC BAA-1160 / DSM 100696 / MI-1) TaxID=349161 RepID=A4J4V6_DESRM|nr:Na/Pi cotransporter family protein [Desulforamulus reducens]ABO50109.1 Na/Pi-cotransporter II-related protein [Desulforamulus reducens MI-1]